MPKIMIDKGKVRTRIIQFGMAGFLDWLEQQSTTLTDEEIEYIFDCMIKQQYPNKIKEESIIKKLESLKEGRCDARI